MTKPLIQPPFQRIVVPTDLEACSSAAVERAYRLLAGGGGRVLLIHVTQPDRVRSISEEEDATIEVTLAAQAPSWAAGAGIVTDVKSVHRLDLVAGILEAADQFQGDLICMGSRGRGSLARKLLGSVAEGVLRHTELPVLVVPASPDP